MTRGPSSLFLRQHPQGVFSRSDAYLRRADVARRIFARITPCNSLAEYHFPPVTSRRLVSTVKYDENFPHLLGYVHTLRGDTPSSHPSEGGDSPDDLCLLPAACYPVYPLIKSEHSESWNAHVCVEAHCFRAEPSHDLHRMQSFTMRESVFWGDPQEVLQFRERCIERCNSLFQELGLQGRLNIASDPFWGRLAKLKNQVQQDAGSKYEYSLPCDSSGSAVACISFNYHETKLASLFNIRSDNGASAHTSCVAVGIERLVLALAFHFGDDFSGWPSFDG